MTLMSSPRRPRRFLSPLPPEALTQRAAGRPPGTHPVRVKLRGDRFAAVAFSGTRALPGSTAVLIERLIPTTTGGTLIEGEQRVGVVRGVSAFMGFLAVLLAIDILVLLLSIGRPDLMESLWNSNLAMALAMPIGAPIGWRCGGRRENDALRRDVIGAAMRETFAATELP